MDETLLSMLENDEHLIWQSKPEDFETLDKTHKKVFITRVIAAVITAAVIIASYLIVILRGDGDINTFFIIATIVLCALSPISIFNYAYKLRKKTIYAASNKRLIVYSGDFKATDYEMIKTACFRQDEDGHTTLLCGKAAVDSKPSKWRMLSLFGSNDLEAEGGPICEHFVFYALENSAELKEVLAPYLKIE